MKSPEGGCVCTDTLIKIKQAKQNTGSSFQRVWQRCIHYIQFINSLSAENCFYCAFVNNRSWKNEEYCIILSCRLNQRGRGERRKAEAQWRTQKMQFLFSRFVLSFLIFCHHVLQTARSVQKEGKTKKERVKGKGNTVHTDNKDFYAS